MSSRRYVVWLNTVRIEHSASLFISFLLHQSSSELSSGVMHS